MGRFPMIVLSPYAKGNHYSNSTYYTHSSTLRTIQEIFGVYPLIRYADSATDLKSMFSSVSVRASASNSALLRAKAGTAGLPIHVDNGVAGWGLLSDPLKKRGRDAQVGRGFGGGCAASRYRRSSGMAQNRARNGSGQIVIVFKDGHRQSFNLADVARIEFPGRRRSVADAGPTPAGAPPSGTLSGQVGSGRWKRRNLHHHAE